MLAMLGADVGLSAAMERCSGGKGHHCVVDGDTVWIGGEKIRLAGIDAPEIAGACDAERRLALVAARRLASLLSAGTVDVEREGFDRYGRTLATLNVAGAPIGALMVEEGLARTWTGRRQAWCNRP